MRNDVTIYVGIDFSKEKFNACLLMEQGVMGESEFPNTKTGYLKLTKWVKNTSNRDVHLTLPWCCSVVSTQARAVLDSANIFMPRE